MTVPKRCRGTVAKAHGEPFSMRGARNARLAGRLLRAGGRGSKRIDMPQLVEAFVLTGKQEPVGQRYAL